jgi:acylphosphatase
VVVAGRVQGVFFRDSCERRATAEGVAGWVANRNDGRLEAVFEGPADAVDRMVRWCRIGPSRSDVTGVEVTDEPPEGERGFRVRG